MIQESNIIDVKTSNMKIASQDEILRSSGIGSCIVITLYDSIKKVGALAHPMIASPKGQNLQPNLRFVENAIDAMVDALLQVGASKERLKSKIFGGAHMFKVFDNDLGAIGIKNVEAAKQKLKKLGIPVVVNDTGGNVGRSVIFDLKTGLVEVKTKV